MCQEVECIPKNRKLSGVFFLFQMPAWESSASEFAWQQIYSRRDPSIETKFHFPFQTYEHFKRLVAARHLKIVNIAVAASRVRRYEWWSCEGRPITGNNLPRLATFYDNKICVHFVWPQLF